jgi:hypothetical protein
MYVSQRGLDCQYLARDILQFKSKIVVTKIIDGIESEIACKASKNNKKVEVEGLGS